MTMEKDRIRLSVTIYREEHPKLFADLTPRSGPSRARRLRSLLLLRESDLTPEDGNSLSAQRVMQEGGIKAVSPVARPTPNDATPDVQQEKPKRKFTKLNLDVAAGFKEDFEDV